MALILPLKLAYGLADFIGSIYYLLAKRDRIIAANNIATVLAYTKSQAKIEDVTRGVFRNFSRYLAEFLRSAKIDLNFINKNIIIEGKENLDRALSLNKGALLVSAHLGNWELGAMFLSLLGYKVNVVAWTHKNKLVNNFFLRQRASKGLKTIPLGLGVKKVFLALKNNEIVGLLGDVDYAQPDMGVKVKFFGQDTVMPKGPAAFSLKTGAPIVPIFLLRARENKFRVFLKEPIVNHQGNDKTTAADITQLTQQLTQVLEASIALDPGQWFMLTPRFQRSRFT